MFSKTSRSQGLQPSHGSPSTPQCCWGCCSITYEGSNPVHFCQKHHQQALTKTSFTLLEVYESCRPFYWSGFQIFLTLLSSAWREDAENTDLCPTPTFSSGNVRLWNDNLVAAGTRLWPSPVGLRKGFWVHCKARKLHSWSFILITESEVCQKPRSDHVFTCKSHTPWISSGFLKGGNDKHKVCWSVVW